MFLTFFMYICAMKDVKAFKRQMKEANLYGTFLSVERQAKVLDLHKEYLNLCEELLENGFLKEFFEIVTNKHTLGLKGCVNYASNDFHHVLDFMKSPADRKGIVYDGNSMRYEEFLKIKDKK